jgi:hypothetical protein
MYRTHSNPIHHITYSCHELRVLLLPPSVITVSKSHSVASAGGRLRFAADSHNTGTSTLSLTRSDDSGSTGAGPRNTCFSTVVDMDVKPSWETLVADKQRRQQAAIPDAWRIAVPGPEVVDVSDVPRACGLLSTQELEITETTDVDVLLAKLAARQWTSVEVTTAFYKRAIIAQQLVCRVLVSLRVLC